MIFKKLEINNFLSYHHESFNDFGDHGLILIEGKNLDDGGSNGAGKSGIFDSILWAIFGKTARGLEKDAVVNRKFKSDCHVSLTVGLDDGTDIVINRYRASLENGNRLFCTDDGKHIEYGSTDETQRWIVSRLGIDMDLFKCTVFFSQGETFNFVNSTNKQQKEILSKVMRIDFSKYVANAKLRLQEINSKCDDVKRKIDVLDMHIAEDQTGAFDEDISRWSRERDEKIESMMIDNAEINLKISQIDIKPVDKLNEVKNKISSLISTMNSDLAKLRDSRAKISSNIEFFKKEIVVAKELKGKCRVCYQDINESDVKSRIVEFAKDLKKHGEALSYVDSDIASKVKEIDELRSKLTKLSEMIVESKMLAEKYESLCRTLDKNIKLIDELKSSENPFIKKKNDAIEKREKILIKRKELEADFSKLRESVPYFSFWVDAFGDSGIKSFIFDIICSTLTNQTNKYLNILSNGSVTVSFDTQKKLKSGEYREKFDCIITTNGESVPYEAYSGGEKRRISLAVDMALSDLMSDYYHSKFNIVVFDEQTNFLDRSGRESFMRLLRDISKNKKVFVVDHDAEFKSMFDKTLVIEKKEDISRCVSLSS